MERPTTSTPELDGSISAPHPHLDAAEPDWNEFDRPVGDVKLSISDMTEDLQDLSTSFRPKPSTSTADQTQMAENSNSSSDISGASYASNPDNEMSADNSQGMYPFAAPNLLLQGFFDQAPARKDRALEAEDRQEPAHEDDIGEDYSCQYEDEDEDEGGYEGKGDYGGRTTTKARAKARAKANMKVRKTTRAKAKAIKQITTKQIILPSSKSSWSWLICDLYSARHTRYPKMLG